MYICFCFGLKPQANMKFVPVMHQMRNWIACVCVHEREGGCCKEFINLYDVDIFLSHTQLTVV